MASIKNAKKDIKSITFEVAYQCYSFMDSHPDKEFPELEDLVDELLDVEENTLQALKARDAKADKKQNRGYIKEVKEEFIQKSNEILDKINTKIETEG